MWITGSGTDHNLPTALHEILMSLCSNPACMALTALQHRRQIMITSLTFNPSLVFYRCWTHSQGGAELDRGGTRGRGLQFSRDVDWVWRHLQTLQHSRILSLSTVLPVKTQNLSTTHRVPISFYFISTTHRSLLLSSVILNPFCF